MFTGERSPSALGILWPVAYFLKAYGCRKPPPSLGFTTHGVKSLSSLVNDMPLTWLRLQAQKAARAYSSLGVSFGPRRIRACPARVDTQSCDYLDSLLHGASLSPLTSFSIDFSRILTAKRSLVFH